VNVALHRAIVGELPRQQHTHNIILPSGNDIRQIKILDRILQCLPSTLTPLRRLSHIPQPSSRQTRRLNDIIPRQTRRNIIHPLPQRMNIIIRQRRPQILTQRTNNLPILTRNPRGRDRSTGILRSALEVDVRGRLFSVGGPREDDVGVLGAKIAVVALVDYKGVFGDGFRVYFVGVEEEEDFGGEGGCFAVWRDKANVIGCCA
jgi:hypothetical protein